MTMIYLSSTYQDLKDHRKAVFDALRQSGYQVIAMEDYVATDERPVDKCLKDVDCADIYVGLFAFRYGYVPPAEHGNPDGRSITELEYRRAAANPKTHTLVFLADDKAPWPMTSTDGWTGDGQGGARVRSLRDELGRERLASFFSSPHELASKVQSAVIQIRPPRGSGEHDSGEAPSLPTWDLSKHGSPYPGLLHFNRRYAPVFFGRELEIGDVLDRLRLPEARFLIVSGDSGSGKSSLVDAGVLPRLEQQGLADAARVQTARLAPSRGSDPFDALLRVLHGLCERAGLDAYQLAQGLAEDHEDLAVILERLLHGGLQADLLVLFLDQMEELFVADGTMAVRFLSGLHQSAHSLPLRVIATIRSDFLHHCYRHTEMLQVLRGPGHYPLGRVAPYRLHDLILRPAQCAGVSVPDGLVRRLVDDLGTEPGNLPLLAFALRRLFDAREDRQMTLDAYDAMGGLEGAIAEHADDVERGLASAMDPSILELRLSDLFRCLVRVDGEGSVTRRRVSVEPLPEAVRPIAEALIRQRLLAAEGEGPDAIVSVAHERLFGAWPALARWIAGHQDDLRLVHQAELEALEWRRQAYDLRYLWHTERLRRLQAAIGEPQSGHISDVLRDFAWPQWTLIPRLDDLGLDQTTRVAIGDLLTELGDPRPGIGVREDGTPDIDWVEIPGGTVTLKDDGGTAEVAPFRIARYLVTNAQFDAFLSADDGYSQTEWWEEMPADAKTGSEAPSWSEPNRPRETVSWYEAVAFCRWLSHRLALDIRLPSEFEWQQAATGGDPSNLYPWGPEWDSTRCNTAESGLGCTTAVGLYPAGASVQGVLDLAGNLWEWCASKRKDSIDLTIDSSGESRVLRGGSWRDYRGLARADLRYDRRPVDRFGRYGFRVLWCSPIR
ncbi:Sigma 54 interacting domain protein [Thiorhodococcus drewsii AZ1]|uniref:Sigma 54 interacting domain protein n=1 Tax=Thiorhodococcus drewsii AZ1 TaxID=765913 RepID=G2E5P6_9GAMM|nr:SUMF1/EgtB/PvdO family nonheme iron enzyme [Thiorhodococcus drewsii]EGV28617.1 Sigma 54 interacting domain protein [Thiorhodococcus drewsii AZ1]